MKFGVRELLFLVLMVGTAAASFFVLKRSVTKKQTLETQMASGLGTLGGSVQVGFRQVGGSSGSILMVIAFPAGSLSAAAYQAAVAVMGSNLGATFSTSTVDGVDVANGKAKTGGVAMFHIADHLLVVISPLDSESLPIATAIIHANQ